ncbi:MAG: hypothetical protein PVG99_07660 [Desulfobacteraceae bacterium]|jgi:hypothetical protein
MIYALTLNPALDRAIVVERLREEDTTRVISETHYAAGKGIDVSRVIKELVSFKSVGMDWFGSPFVFCRPCPLSGFRFCKVHP